MRDFFIGFVCERIQLNLVGIALFRSPEDDIVFLRLFSFKICVRHSARVCVYNLFVRRIVFGFQTLLPLHKSFETKVLRFILVNENTILALMPCTFRDVDCQ